MKSGLGRVLAGVCVTAALAATTACGSGSDGGKSDGKSADKPADKPAATSSSEAPTALRPLSEAQLAQAAITKADVKGFSVGKVPDDEIPDMSVPADPAECQAIADMFLLGSEPDAAARVARSVTSLTETDATVVQMGLLAHQEADAKKVLADLRAASEKCDAYEHTDYKYSGIEPRKAPALGDEAVSYAMTGKIDGETIPMTYVVVRTGSTVAAFYGMNVLDAKQAEVPAEIIETQIAKLEKVAGAKQ
ncbi:hypothetical protein OKJ48_34275 [Streptomyces kunmingensis]|uniref:Lipoprotein n=1 Tax=Streptomyces kunmingensis TaxID=68225 RepID=A0ABU6CM11_9ACTN|nr:hypothetical protein [Streptomyces kunmingensis]MEB3965256.1 hypothetical protein [Streptomyces kunmingensis]